MVQRYWSAREIRGCADSSESTFHRQRKAGIWGEPVYFSPRMARWTTEQVEEGFRRLAEQSGAHAKKIAGEVSATRERSKSGAQETAS